MAITLTTLTFGTGVFSQSLEDSYTNLRPVVPTQTADKVEVVEIFWYGCPTCYNFEPYLQKWKGNIPDNAEFRRIPGAGNRNWVPHAKAYYAAEKLGVLDRIHQPLFDAIHKEKRNIHDEETIKEFFVELGIDGDEFSRAYNSMEVTTNVRKADVMSRKYKVGGVPAIIINGKYQTSPSKAGGYDNAIRVINTLIQRESTGS